jgi:uncharacterized protein
VIYLDTSSLAKAYVHEIGSDQVRALLSATTDSIAVSSLSLLEFRCALTRRTRARTLSDTDAQRIWSSFETDLDDGVFDVLPVDNHDHVSARRLIDTVAPLPLKALDALHLAVMRRATSARESVTTQFVTADAQQAAAAIVLGISTQTIALQS